MTVQKTSWLEVLETVAVNVTRWFSGAVAEGGETLTVIAAVTVTEALPDFDESMALVAVKVTGLVEGKEAGAR
ncbi:MAG: hypothetical protein ACRD50_12455 [Candidatus Acidiferrales bacterium]